MPSTSHSIEKLQKKLNKDPNSLIFFQLAEEYRKEGNLEEALRILKYGLTRHPNYWSARVTLGRVYHQMGNEPSAREELEKVVQSVPDNLLANRLLGDIYTGMQLPAEALKRYRIVHMLTPADHDLDAQIKRLESEVAPVQTAPAQQLESLAEAELEPEEEPEPAAPALEQTLVEAPAPESEHTLVEAPVAGSEHTIVTEPVPESYAPTIQMKIPDFLEKTEVSAPEVALNFLETAQDQEIKVSPETEKTPELDEVEKQILIAEEEFKSVLDEDLFASDTLILEPPDNEEDLQEMTDDPMKQVSDSDELTSLASLLLSTEKASVEQREFEELESELEEEPDFAVEELFRDPQQDRTQPIESEEDSSEADELTSETLAELYLSQGFVDKAIKVYQRLLLNDPGNRQILQRLRELSSDDSTPFHGEEVYQEQDILNAEQEQPVAVEASASKDVTRRDEVRRRKISTLENWLTTIRRERD